MKKHANEVLLGAFMLGALLLLAYMSVAVGGIRVGRGVHVTARFANASGLVKDAAVMIAGVNVGHVESLSVEGDQAVVRAFVSDDAKVREDVKATIRAKSLLGEKYLELKPQGTTAPLLKNGDTIADTTVPVEIDQLVTGLGPVIKDVDPQDLAVITHSLATALKGHDAEIADALPHVSALLRRADALLAANGDHVTATMAHLDDLTTRADKLLAANGDRIDRIARNLDTVSAEAPGLVARADRMATSLEDASKRAPGLAAKADAAMADLPKAVKDLDGLAKRLNSDLDRIDPLVAKAGKADEAQIRAFAKKILRDDGIRVHLY